MTVQFEENSKLIRTNWWMMPLKGITLVKVHTKIADTTTLKLVGSCTIPSYHISSSVMRNIQTQLESLTDTDIGAMDDDLWLFAELPMGMRDLPDDASLARMIPLELTLCHMKEDEEGDHEIVEMDFSHIRAWMERHLAREGKDSTVYITSELAARARLEELIEGLQEWSATPVPEAPKSKEKK